MYQKFSCLLHWWQQHVRVGRRRLNSFGSTSKAYQKRYLGQGNIVFRLPSFLITESLSSPLLQSGRYVTKNRRIETGNVIVNMATEVRVPLVWLGYS
jgi:hypothetical protein